MRFIRRWWYRLTHKKKVVIHLSKDEIKDACNGNLQRVMDSINRQIEDSLKSL